MWQAPLLESKVYEFLATISRENPTHVRKCVTIRWYPLAETWFH